MTAQNNAMMLDLFRGEVQLHADSLSTALLSLERAPDDQHVLNGMMRAAHSIKGAARIVGIPSAVDVSHVMEDCLVAAKQGELTLHAADIDVLLRGVDVLTRIADATKDADFDWSQLRPEIEQTVAALQTVRGGQAEPSQPESSQPEPSQAESSQPEPSQPEPSQPEPRQAEPRQAEPSQPALSQSAPPPSDATANVHVIRVPELLDHAAAEAIRRDVLPLLDADAAIDQLHVDLSATADVDGPGLIVLAALQRRSRVPSKPVVRLVHARPAIDRILSLIDDPA